MAYTPDVFADDEAGNTPITAAKLNKLGTGVQSTAGVADAANAALASKANSADVTTALATKADLVGGKVPAAQLPDASGTSASAVTLTPTGTVQATTVQDAVAELAAESVFSADVDTIVQITQAAYDALATKDARTLYVIV